MGIFQLKVSVLKVRNVPNPRDPGGETFKPEEGGDNWIESLIVLKVQNAKLEGKRSTGRQRAAGRQRPKRPPKMVPKREPKCVPKELRNRALWGAPKCPEMLCFLVFSSQNGSNSDTKSAPKRNQESTSKGSQKGTRNEAKLMPKSGSDVIIELKV